MKATLYEALGIQPGSSDEEVRAALRRLIRKYYAKTRDGQGNVEEALRFINHASRILTDDARRQNYDEELALSAGTAEQRIAHVVSNAVADAGEQTDVHSAPLPAAPQLEDYLDTQPAGKAPPEGVLHHPGLTERVATSVRSPFVALGLCVLFGAFIVAAVVFVTPPDVVPVAKQALVWITLALLGLTIVYGVVHGLAYNRTRPTTPSQIGLTPQTDLAILNWRREKSVFMGASQPRKTRRGSSSFGWPSSSARNRDARASRGRGRAWARACSITRSGVSYSRCRSPNCAPAARWATTLSYWLPHPLVAPIIITATWIPLEALLIAALGTTPGKWLFGVYLQFSISDAYARRDARAQVRRGLARALRVWWKGMACGFPLVAPVSIALAYEKLAHDQETDWDFAEDCLVTHGPAGPMNLATGVLGLAAMLWLYAVAWNAPMAEALGFVRTSIAHAIPMSSPLPGATGSGKIGVAGRPVTSAQAMPQAVAPPATAATAISGAPANAGIPSAQSGIDPEVDAILARHRARIEGLKAEGPRMLRAGNWRRAAELCREWTDVDLGNAEAWRCLGDAQQALGNYKDALAAYRRAKQYDPNDRAIDGAIERAQRGIITEFLARYRR